MCMKTLWALFHVETVKMEIKQQPDGVEPLMYRQSDSFPAAFWVFFPLLLFFPSLHTHAHTHISLVLLQHDPQNKWQVWQN